MLLNTALEECIKKSLNGKCTTVERALKQFWWNFSFWRLTLGLCVALICSWELCCLCLYLNSCCSQNRLVIFTHQTESLFRVTVKIWAFHHCKTSVIAVYFAFFYSPLCSPFILCSLYSLSLPSSLSLPLNSWEITSELMKVVWFILNVALE